MDKTKMISKNIRGKHCLSTRWGALLKPANWSVAAIVFAMTFSIATLSIADNKMIGAPATDDSTAFERSVAVAMQCNTCHRNPELEKAEPLEGRNHETLLQLMADYADGTLEHPETPEFNFNSLTTDDWNLLADFYASQSAPGIKGSRIHKQKKNEKIWKKRRNQ